MALPGVRWSEGDTPLGHLLATDSAVWVARPQAGFVDRIDPQAGAIVNSFKISELNLPDTPTLAFDSLWVLGLNSSKVMPLNPQTGEPTGQHLEVDVPLASHMVGAPRALWLLGVEGNQLIKVTTSN